VPAHEKRARLLSRGVADAVDALVWKAQPGAARAALHQRLLKGARRWRSQVALQRQHKDPV
jgi:hypothetical protein